MKNQQLRAFLAVAQHKSIRGAARSLGLTQPAVTRIVRELEADFDVPLVRRSVAGVALTEFGLALEVRAKLLLEEMRKTREELDSIKNRTGGRVTLAVSPTVAMTILPRSFDLFTSAMPATHVEVAESSPTLGLEALREGSLDFFVTHLLGEPGEPMSSEFENLTLFTCSFVIGARASHPQIHATSLADLLHERWCLQSYGEHGGGLFDAIFSDNKLAQPKRIIRSQSFVVALGLAQATDTLCLITEPLYSLRCRHYGIETIQVREKLPSVTVAVVRRRGAAPSSAVHHFIACLQQSAFEMLS